MFEYIDDIVRANKSAGLHFFPPKTMRSWGTFLSTKIYPVEGGAFFVTSEVWADDKRYWTVRYARDNGRVWTFSPGYRATSPSRAHKIAKRAARVANAISGR